MNLVANLLKQPRFDPSNAVIFNKYVPSLRKLLLISKPIVIDPDSFVPFYDPQLVDYSFRHHQIPIIPPKILFRNKIVSIGHADLIHAISLDFSVSRYFMLQETAFNKRFINLSDLPPLTNEQVSVIIKFRRVLSKLPKTAMGVLIPPESEFQLYYNIITGKPFKNATSPSTIIRLGYSATTITKLSEFNTAKFVNCVQKSFGKQLTPTYLSEVKANFEACIMCNDYSGVVLLLRKKGFIYMDKFAIDPKHQGDGLSDILFEKLNECYPDCFWRSRLTNPINHWYFGHSDGNFQIDPNFMLFWYGQNGLGNIAKYCEIAKEIEPSFVDNL